MPDVQGGAERGEVVLASGRPLAQAEEAIGELLAVVGGYGADPHRACALQVAQEAPGIGRGLGGEDADEHHRVARSIATKR